MAVLAPAYLPRRPTETVLYGLVRQHLESFLAYAREHYDGGLPRYVENELRAYLKCGVFSEGFTRCHCDACGHDLLVAFSCKSRTVCPSCAGRRMANTAAAIVDRVLPDVPVRQYVLSLPYELRSLAAFKAGVLTALGRVFVEAVFASYRRRAKRRGIAAAQCGAINFVQRFGSMNLNVHFHVVVLDGVFTRDARDGVPFHAAPPPAREELDAIVGRTRDRAVTWLRPRPERASSTAADAQPTGSSSGVVALLAPNVLSVRHWDRLMRGALYAATPRLDWASLLRRSFEVDVVLCPRCQGRLRVLAVITEREPVQRILAHLGLPTDPPPRARARDPTDDDVDEVESPPEQLELRLA